MLYIDDKEEKIYLKKIEEKNDSFTHHKNIY